MRGSITKHGLASVASKPGKKVEQQPLRLLHVSPSFYPAVAYGGPIFSTKAITDGIAAVPGFSVEVLTTDTADPNSDERLKVSKKLSIILSLSKVCY